MDSSEYSFTRYLAAKRSVDDRALNNQVWQCLSSELQSLSHTPLSILEVGGGIGTMIERMLERDLWQKAEYTLLDAQADNIQMAGERLAEWAELRGWLVQATESGLWLQQEGCEVRVRMLNRDLHSYLNDSGGELTFDLLVAHAFLDLVDIPATLPGLFQLLRSGGLFYFTLNFDGETIFEPLIDPGLDHQIIEIYHRSMDQRMVGGKPSGDNQAGRHMFHNLKTAGVVILEAGASDWVVYAGQRGYPEDEAYFMHYIIHTLDHQLRGHPEIDPERLAAWVDIRHAQIEHCELVYIAHQLDFVGRVWKASMV